MSYFIEDEKVWHAFCTENAFALKVPLVPSDRNDIFREADGIGFVQCAYDCRAYPTNYRTLRIDQLDPYWARKHIRGFANTFGKMFGAEWVASLTLYEPTDEDKLLAIKRMHMLWEEAKARATKRALESGNIVVQMVQEPTPAVVQYVNGHWLVDEVLDSDRKGVLRLSYEEDVGSAFCCMSEHGRGEWIKMCRDQPYRNWLGIEVAVR